jgi:hypothetical protein
MLHLQQVMVANIHLKRRGPPVNCVRLYVILFQSEQGLSCVSNFMTILWVISND